MVIQIIRYGSSDRRFTTVTRNGLRKDLNLYLESSTIQTSQPIGTIIQIQTNRLLETEGMTLLTKKHIKLFEANKTKKRKRSGMIMVVPRPNSTLAIPPRKF